MHVSNSFFPVLGSVIMTAETIVRAVEAINSVLVSLRVSLGASHSASHT